MSQEKICPLCGSNKIGKGKQMGHGRMMPIGKFITTGSDVLADICTKCGHILSMKVAAPEKFR